MVVVDLDGNVVEGTLRPSSDTATHLVLYRGFEQIGGIAHTHSRYATMFAQARREIPCLGTTHADQFFGPVPVTRPLAESEVAADYEGNTGRVIVERFAGLGSDGDAGGAGGGARAVYLGTRRGRCGPERHRPGSRGRDGHRNLVDRSPGRAAWNPTSSRNIIAASTGRRLLWTTITS